MKCDILIQRRIHGSFFFFSILLFLPCQAKHATKYGATGLILFSDPADYAVENDLGVYPDTWYLPGTGVQRGSLHIPMGLGGDPLSPGYPSYGEHPFSSTPPPFAFNKNRTVREFDWIFTNHPSRSCLSFFCSCSKQIFIRVAFPFKRTCPIMPDESDRYVLYLIGGGSSGLWGCWVDTVLWPSWLCRREWFRGVPRHLVFTRNGGTEGITVLLSECRRRSFISRLPFLWYVILVASTSGMYLFYSAKLLAQL